MLAHEVGVFAQRLVGTEEQHAECLEVLAQLVVDDLGVVLSADAGEQTLLLGLGDAELVVGVLDVVGHVLPRRFVAVGGAHVVVDVIEVDVTQLAAPDRHRARVEVVERLEPDVAHPGGLVLDVGDGVDDVGAEPLGQLDHRLDIVVEAELVLGTGSGDWCGGHTETKPSWRAPLRARARPVSCWNGS